MVNQLAQNVEVFELEFHFICNSTGKLLNTQLMLLLKFQGLLNGHGGGIKRAQINITIRGTAPVSSLITICCCILSNMTSLFKHVIPLDNKEKC